MLQKPLFDLEQIFEANDPSKERGPVSSFPSCCCELRYSSHSLWNVIDGDVENASFQVKLLLSPGTDGGKEGSRVLNGSSRQEDEGLAALGIQPSGTLKLGSSQDRWSLYFGLSEHLLEVTAQQNVNWELNS